MALHRGIGGSEPVRPEPSGRVSGTHEERRSARSTHLASGTLACPECDAPVVPLPGAMSPADPLGCPFCSYAGAARDFLSLVAPSRPARVDVRVVEAGRLIAKRS